MKVVRLRVADGAGYNLSRSRWAKLGQGERVEADITTTQLNIGSLDGHGNFGSLVKSASAPVH